LDLAELDEAVTRALKVARLQPAPKDEATSSSGTSITYSSAQPVPYDSADGSTQAKDVSPPPLGQEKEAWHVTSRGAYQGGVMSPRLTYGLLFEPDRYIRVSHPPAELMPYLGDGEHSLAGTLFWGTAELGCMILNQYQSHKTQSKPSSPSMAQLADAIFGRCFRLEPQQVLVKRMSTKLRLRTSGSMDEYDHDASARLNYLVVQDLIQQGDALSNYLNAVQVVEYIRQRYASVTMERLETAARNRQEQANMKFMTRFVGELAVRCILFGDGPRWKVESVDSVVESSLLTV
jgi:hypothetical protein